MSQQWGKPGVYQLQQQTLQQNGNQGAGGGPQEVLDVPANGESHYGLNKLTITVWVEDPTAGALPLQNRRTIELYNAGGAVFEVDTNKAFIYGTTGRPVAIGAALSLVADQTVKHYVQCVGGSTCDVRITEVGGPS